MREALLGRMRQASFAGDIGPTAALASGGPTTTVAYADDLGSSPAASALTNAGGGRLTISPGAPPAAVPATYSWIQAIDSWDRFGGDGDAATASRSLGGFFAGVDHRFDSNWLAGVAGGYTNSSVSVSDRGSTADIGAAHLAGYVAASFGPWSLRSAAAASFSALDATRSLAFPGFAETASAHYDAATTQVFSEASYGMTLGKIAAEPFGGLAFAHLNVDDFAESTGGVAALSGSAPRQQHRLFHARRQGRHQLCPVQRHGVDAARLGRLAARPRLAHAHGDALVPEHGRDLRDRRPADRARHGPFRGRARSASQPAGRRRTVLFRPTTATTPRTTRCKGNLTWLF